LLLLIIRLLIIPGQLQLLLQLTILALQVIWELLAGLLLSFDKQGTNR